MLYSSKYNFCSIFALFLLSVEVDNTLLVFYVKRAFGMDCPCVIKRLSTDSPEIVLKCP